MQHSTVKYAPKIVENANIVLIKLLKAQDPMQHAMKTALEEQSEQLKNNQSS